MKKRRISAKWRRMAEIYKLFCYIDLAESMSEHCQRCVNDYNDYYDYSEEAALQMYIRETYGEYIDLPSGKLNGFQIGKQWMDLTITEYWIPDLKNKELSCLDLYNTFPKWFLDKVLPKEFRVTDE
jgi:hypothetical protein